MRRGFSNKNLRVPSKNYRIRRNCVWKERKRRKKLNWRSKRNFLKSKQRFKRQGSELKQLKIRNLSMQKRLDPATDDSSWMKISVIFTTIMNSLCSRIILSKICNLLASTSILKCHKEVLTVVNSQLLRRNLIWVIRIMQLWSSTTTWMRMEVRSWRTPISLGIDFYPNSQPIWFKPPDLNTMESSMISRRNSRTRISSFKQCSRTTLPTKYPTISQAGNKIVHRCSSQVPVAKLSRCTSPWTVSTASTSQSSTSSRRVDQVSIISNQI